MTSELTDGGERSEFFHSLRETWEQSAHHASSYEIKCTDTTSEHSVLNCILHPALWLMKWVQEE